MAGKSLFDLKRGDTADAEPGTFGGAGGNQTAPLGSGRDEALSIGAAFGASAADAIADAADPEAPFGRFPDGTPRKRRPRGSAGTASAPRKSSVEQKGDIAGIESLLISIHLMGVVALKAPSFALDEVSAKRLATAIQNVQAQYPFVIDAKTQAWMNLAAIGGIIYVPRIISLANAAKKPKAVPQAQSQPSPEQAREAVLSEAPVVAPDPKGPLTPGQLFGSYAQGG